MIILVINVVIVLLSANVSALKIHMSENAHDAIVAFPEFITESRGFISVKVQKLLYLKKYVFFAHTYFTKTALRC